MSKPKDAVEFMDTFVAQPPPNRTLVAADIADAVKQLRGRDIGLFTSWICLICGRYRGNTHQGFAIHFGRKHREKRVEHA